MIKAIAIDDEIPALKVLENFCARTEHIQLDKVFNKPVEALKHLRKFPVDLLFLDINMPSITGIELYKAIEQKTMVIFTTAYSEYAVEGFNLNALDYLLKPFTYERFTQAMQKAADNYSIQHAIESKEQTYLLVRADYSLIKINTADILFIEGLDDYLKIHLLNQKPLVARMTMKAMQLKLSPKDFFRIHRSYIIAIKHVQQVKNRTITIAGDEIPIGASYEEAFLDFFNK
ncbi:LytR/AlgR family response regulator transcription factor [Limnovirga soli]|uniref:Response regulator n=1 Tax=Limnovirga soli TaxID=2656915 RepID=A0A8J8JTN5_9BACT|nr:LytTR family DNA-binding domain-containing protein [Limnovirga soli]NNV56133.1 response regulator [Limnovirga soli]